MAIRKLKDRPYTLMTLAVLFWAGNFILGRAFHSDIPPIALAFWRWAVASLLIIGPAFKHLRKDRAEILADIGLGRRLAAVVARQLMLAGPAGGPPAPGDVITETSRSLFASAGPVVIRGTEGMALQASSCCGPIPGDAIVGHMRKDQGLAVHQADCPVAARGRRADPERWIDLQWAEDASGPFAAKLAVSAANERGTLARIAVAIAEAESNIVNVNMEDESAEQAQLNFKLQVRDRRHLARVMRMLRRVPQVSRVVRVKPGDKGGSE